jgi:hypothetical protein
MSYHIEWTEASYASKSIQVVDPEEINDSHGNTNEDRAIVIDLDGGSGTVIEGDIGMFAIALMEKVYPGFKEALKQMSTACPECDELIPAAMPNVNLFHAEGCSLHPEGEAA